MRRISGLPAILLGSAIVFASGCGQGEGGRCQVASDCKGGLVCDKGSTGNGVCIPSNGTGITRDDAGPDTAITGGPEVQPEADSASAADLASAVDSEPASAPDATASVDAGALDTM
jgi:hypothetical protein